MYFRYIDFKQSVDQIHFLKLINYEIAEKVLPESMRNVVIKDEFPVPTAIDKIYILIVLKQKK